MEEEAYAKVEAEEEEDEGTIEVSRTSWSGHRYTSSFGHQSSIPVTPVDSAMTMVKIHWLMMPL